jgi:hypothetical protein
MINWIRTSNQLPDFDKAVLVTVYPFFHDPYVTIAALDNLIGWIKDNNMPLLFSVVVAWAELPEPYVIPV